MLTRTKARAWVDNSAFFARGRTYAEEGRVRLVRSERLEGEALRYEARVVGERCYDVSVAFDETDLLDCRCDCPGFERTGAMCKHVAALLIALCGEDERARDDARLREAARREAERREEEMAERQRDELDDLLFWARMRRENAVNRRHVAKGDVRLSPILRFQKGSVGLELRIGRARMYAVRGMAAFGLSAARGQSERYGKELTFYHTEEELRPQDVPLYRLVVELAGQEKRVRGAQLLLEGAELDAVMRLLLGGEVELRVDDGEAKRVRVVEGAGEVVGALAEGSWGVRLTVAVPRMAVGARGAYLFCPEAGEIRCALGERYAALQPLLRIARCFPSGVRMDKGRLCDVCAQVLIPAGDALRLTQGREILLARTPMAMRPRFFVDMEGRERLTCRVEYDYGAAVLSDARDNPHIRRDALGEEDARIAARRLFPKEERPGCFAFEGGEEAVFSLLSERLSELSRDGEVMIAERLTQMNIARPRTMTFGVSKSGTRLLVRADLGGLSQPELEAAYLAYRQKRKYVRLTDGAFLSGEALEQAADAAQMLRALDVSVEELAKGANVPLNRAMYLEAALAGRPQMALDAPGEIEGFVRRLNEARQAQAEPPRTLRAKLRPYQLAGYGWLCAMEGAGFGGILADDMGLGKTLQALAMLLRAKERGERVRALVVCPASLQLNWQMEAARFAPSLRCEVLAGTASARRAAIAREDAPELLITSYDQLRRDTQAYHGVTFSHVLLDEAQSIKNASSQAARAAKALTARSRFALTGTPIENRLSELWSIFDFLMPGYLPPYKRFRERFEAPIVQEDDERARQSLRQLVSPFILRRMKRDVLTDLPEKVEMVMSSEMTPEQRRLYAAHAAKLAGELDAGEEGAQRRMQIFAGLLRLRQLCCDPRLCLEGYAGGSGKLEQCVELCVSAAGEGHRILLFSQFTSMLDLLRPRLEREGLSTFLLTGDTDKAERMELVERFNAGGADVFLISLKAGGTGLNLTGADMVIHYDPWWNTAAQNQATDRAHRIGQTRGVEVIKLIASGSIEERILRMQQEKAELSDGILSGDMPTNALDERTLRELLI